MEKYRNYIQGTNLPKVLKVLGTIYFILAVILAITIFFGYGRITVEGMYYSSSKLNWTAIFTAIGVLFQGALVSSLAIGLGRIIDRCDEIAYKIYNNDKDSSKTKYLRCRNCGALNEDNGYTRRCKECDTNLNNADVIEM